MMIVYIIIFCLLVAFSLRYNWWRMPQSYAKARVLMYHSISEHKGEKHDKWRVKPLDFEKQMLWLSQNGFTSYKISELASLEQIPPKSVAITFDDGYEDNFTNSFKVLQKYNLKATIYLVPNQTTNHWESSNTSHISPMLTHLQIKQMQSSGLIEFGSHTLSHENLSTLDDEILKAELLYSKIEISELTNSACTAFAYPYGKFDERIINATKEAGYTNAVVVKRGFYEAKDDKFSIKRIGVLGTESFFDFWLKFTRIRNKL